ncbi:D-glycerate dehydrogenase [Candidatus Poribacteria bacterium]|nr:D-glycerate dehydrogenase [Candidatus Poribacteria bacterium]
MTNKPKVLTHVPIEDDLMESICEVAEVDQLIITAPRSELLVALKDVDGILLTPRVRADTEFFDAAPKLKVISTTSVGYDPFDIPEATKHGVVVCNTPGVLTAAVANLTIASIFSLALRLFEYEPYVRSGGWSKREKAPPLGTDIQGKILGVIGFGRIGQEVTQRMQALGMRTLWHDVFDVPHSSAPESEYRSLNELLADADFVSLHTNLDASSRHMIGEAELNLMKPTAYLINTARGPLVDQVALTKALQSNQIAGAALDVLEKEPPVEDDPIFTLPNIICFPHIGTATKETRRAMRELAVKNLIAVITGKKPLASVNPEVLG